MNRETLPLNLLIDGFRYEGSYAVQSRMLTVWNSSIGSRSLPLADAPGNDPRQLAEQLFAELVRECGRHGSGLARRYTRGFSLMSD